MAREFDIVIYGATGYTGRLVAEHFLREYGDRLPSIQGAQVLADPFADLTGEIGTAQNASFLVRPDGVANNLVPVVAGDVTNLRSA